MAPVSTRPGLGTAVAVTRWSRAATATAAISVLALAVLAVLPYLAGTGITQALVTLFLLVSMAALWNLLAGYAGMISFGQQAYLGIGAYLVWLVSKTGVSPFAGIAVGGRRLRGGRGSHLRRCCARCPAATSRWRPGWSPTCFFLYVTNQLWLGGGTGVSLAGQLSGLPPVVRQAYTYWLALALMAVIVAGVYLLVRSRFGLDSRAVHDEPAAAAAMGVEVQRTRWLAYILAAVGFGAVGGMLIISTLYIDPATVFSVNYSADMLFMVVIGGHRHDGGPDHRRGHLLRRAGEVLLVRGVVPGGDRRGGDRGGAHRAGGPVGDSRPPRLVAAAGRVPGPRVPAPGPAGPRGRRAGRRGRGGDGDG